MVIPFREWEPKNSSHNGWNSQGIRREGGYGRFLPLSTGSAAHSPHAAAKPLRPTSKVRAIGLALLLPGGLPKHDAGAVELGYLQRSVR